MTAANPEIAHRTSAGGIETNYHDEGHGPAILFIHGSGPGVSAFANWRLTIPALSGRYRVIAPDMVGFGFSDRPKDVAYSRETWVAQAIGLMDALKIDKAHVVGNSFGGAIALAMAIKHPDGSAGSCSWARSVCRSPSRRGSTRSGATSPRSRR